MVLGDAHPGFSGATPLTWTEDHDRSNADAIQSVATACLKDSGT